MAIYQDFWSETTSTIYSFSLFLEMFWDNTRAVIRTCFWQAREWSEVSKTQPRPQRANTCISCCCCSVARSCPTLQPHGLQHTRPPCPSPSSRVAQTHVHWVSDAIQPSHPLSSPSPPAVNLSQYQGLYQWVSSSHRVAKILEPHLSHQSFQWIFRLDFL